MEISFRDIAIAMVSSFVALLSSAAMWFLNLRKTRAEVDKLISEKRKLDAEVEQITSERLLRELDRLATINDEQFVLLGKQRDELSQLRDEIVSYSLKEQAHAAENMALRKVIEELRAGGANLEIPTEGILKIAFPPPEISHQQNEYDSDEPPE